MDTEKKRDGSDAPEGIEDAHEEEIFEPFNPEHIDIVSQPAVLGQLVDRIERRYQNNPSAYICLDPEFQRSEGIWPAKQKSSLIESVLLGIPLPMFYVSASSSGVWDVVDGIQRLGVFRDFMLGNDYLKSLQEGNPNPAIRGAGFKLVDLEFLTQFNGKQFINLPGKQQEDLKGCPLQVTVIRSGTPEAVKFNIFKRINTGGAPLTPQEIRHALHQGVATAFLKELVTQTMFLKATCHSVKDTRMEGRELILRLISTKIFRWEQSTSSKINTEDMLNQTMRILNELGGTPEKTKEPLPEFDRRLTLDGLKAFFTSAMERNYALFGNYAFRKSLPGSARRTQINKALFETWGILLGDLSPEHWKCILSNKDEVLLSCQELYNFSDNTHNFDKSVSEWASLTAVIKWRYSKIKSILNLYKSQRGTE